MTDANNNVTVLRDLSYLGGTRHETLDLYLRDNTQAWLLGADGRYTRREPATGELPHSAQQALLASYCG